MWIEAVLAIAAAAAPATPARYPPALRGRWHVGAAPCRLPAHAGSVGLITIGGDSIRAHESSFTALSVRPASGKRLMWTLEEIEEHEGEARRVRRTIALSGDMLIAAEGRSRTTYVRCTGRLLRRRGAGGRQPAADEAGG